MKGISVIIIVLTLASCLPEPLPVDSLPELKPKIVVSSQMISNQSLVVFLSKSFGALEASGNSDPQELLNEIAINDAIVTLEGSDFNEVLQFVGTGVYGTTNIVFEENDEYILRVASAELGEVMAMATVKEQVRFASLSVEINDTGFDTLATVNYSLQDAPGKNYYMINLQHVDTSELPEPEDFLNPNVFTYLEEDNAENDGQVIGNSFNAFFRRDFIPGDTVLVQLANISEGYYDFLDVRQNSRFNFSDFLGEPVNYPTNVTGGLGWFTLHLPDIRIIIVE